MTEARVKEIAAGEMYLEMEDGILVGKEASALERELATDWLAQRAEIERLEKEAKEFWERLALFRKALDTEGLHGHYNVFHRYFYEELGVSVAAQLRAALTSTQGDGK